jgi:hypothetical protein
MKLQEQTSSLSDHILVKLPPFLNAHAVNALYGIFEEKTSLIKA